MGAVDLLLPFVSTIFKLSVYIYLRVVGFIGYVLRALSLRSNSSDTIYTRQTCYSEPLYHLYLTIHLWSKATHLWCI